VSDYYGARWQLFLTRMINGVRTGVEPDWNKYDADLLQFEQAYVLSVI
jgi:hypothetical protein